MAILRFILEVVRGMGSVLSVNKSALYRYPYYNSGEALRGDWLKIGKDINNTMD